MGCGASKPGSKFDTSTLPKTWEQVTAAPEKEKSEKAKTNVGTKELKVNVETNGIAEQETDNKSDKKRAEKPAKQSVGLDDKKPREGTFEDFYIEGKPLGFGAFANVFIGEHKKSGKQYAVKKIDRAKMFWGDRDALKDEISNMKAVRDGPHIVRLWEEYYKTDDCYLVMELMVGGELFDRIIKKRSFTEKEARDVTRCMLDALQYMHRKRVVHRDLKPENLLLTSIESDTDIKLADFGFAKKIETLNGCRTLCGTPGYLAPEILERWPSYDTKCDLWSVGVILFLLLGGYLPFEDQDEDKVFDRTRNGLYEFHPKYFGRVSNDAKELVTLLLTINASKRYSARKAMDHKWMKQGDQEFVYNELNSDKLKATIRAKEKMKKALNTVIVANRLAELNEGFKHYLENRQADEPKFSIFPSVHRQSILIEDDSKSGKPFSYFYDIGDLLGEGGFSSVYQARHKKSNETYAVKKVTLSELQRPAKNALKDEISALKLLRGGPHIVRLHDIFKDDMFVYMVMEEMKGGELLQRIVEKEVYTEREARQTCKLLFDAIDYCHKKRIAHRDIKPENLLLVDKNDDTSIKIADFGFSKKVTKRRCLSTLCGTAAYVAPEVLDLKIKGYDERADMWSIGVVTFVLLGGYAPFEGPIEHLAPMILEGDFDFDPTYWQHISKGAKGLISSLLTVDPDNRCTAEEALQSDWMTAEEETLTVNDLSIAQEKIRNNLPVEKLRGAVKAVIATNKLTSLGENFTSSIVKGSGRTVDGKVLQFSVRNLDGQSMKNINAFEDSSSGKTFKELYRLGKELGAGDFSVIYEARHKQSGVNYAIKCVSRKDLHSGDAVALQDEISALRVLKDCKYVLTLHDVFDEPDTSYVVLERMHGGDLIDRIIEKAHYTEDTAREVCKNLLEGVYHCHQRKIANRNLKPENLLLVSIESDTEVKICDFGYAKKVLYPNSLRTQCGTEGYVAPEILSHKPAYDVNCDMWSLGVILYIVLGGYRPFRGTADEVMKKIRYGEYEFDEKYWRHVSEEAKSLICRMMTVNPNDRISVADALSSSWINADSASLARNSLSANQERLQTFKGKDKLRQVVKMVMAANKLQSLGSRYRAFQDF